jgi:hypothetical protein
VNRYWFFTLGRARFGVEKSEVMVCGERYLTRYIMYVGGASLRLHKFFRGDDDRAPHCHPFRFWTFPLTDYNETYQAVSARVWDGKGGLRPVWQNRWRRVCAFRWHYRPAEFRHIVLGRADRQKKPFWTFVIAVFENRSWGFWPTPETFVPFREWK